MSDNIYNILNNFNKVAQEPQQPGIQSQPKAKTRLQENMDRVLAEKYKGFKKTVAEGEVEESGLQAYLGNKKYGKKGMDALRKAGREGAGKEKMAQIRTKHDKMDEAAKPDYIDLDKDGNKAEPMKKAAKDAKSKKVQEVAPPGAKAERMVKHIKQGYAKDGKLTKTEKSKAYGASWKARNKGKVEEAVRAMFKAGFTKEQIVEGWDDMMKAVANRSNDMKPGEKRQGAKGEIEKTSSGIKHTRRYDRKTGETETGSDGQQVKRSRGRPKKSTFESSTTAKKMIAEHFRELIEGSIQGGVWTANPPKKGQPNVPVPQNIDGGSVSPAPKKTNPTPPAMGSIKGGVWTSEPPKSGQKGVAAPSALPEDDMEEGNAFSGAVAKAKADGVQPGETIKVGGKTYPVKEGEELLQMLRIAGIKVLEDTQIDECGMSSMGNGMMGQHEQEGRMNVSTNMSSDGNKSVTITADGNSALELMQMLKLAGMDGGEESHAHAGPEGVMVVSTDEDEVEENLEVRANPAGASSIEQAKKIGAQFPQQNGKEPNLAYKIGEEEVEEAKDERYHASTTPDEHVMPVQAQTKGGDGDVAGKEKKMTPHGYQFGDNPQAMKESMSLKLIKEYETIKVKK